MPLAAQSGQSGMVRVLFDAQEPHHVQRTVSRWLRDLRQRKGGPSEVIEFAQHHALDGYTHRNVRLVWAGLPACVGGFSFLQSATKARTPGLPPLPPRPPPLSADASHLAPRSPLFIDIDGNQPQQVPMMMSGCPPAVSPDDDFPLWQTGVRYQPLWESLKADGYTTHYAVTHDIIHFHNYRQRCVEGTTRKKGGGVRVYAPSTTSAHPHATLAPLERTVG